MPIAASNNRSMIVSKSCKPWSLALLLGLLVASTPIRLCSTGESGLTIAFAFAHAKGDNSGSGGGGGDNSGSGSSGSGSSGSGSSGSDSSGSGSGGSGSDDDDNSGSGSGSSGSGSGGDDDRGQRGGSDDDMDLRYINGWRERIQNGRYRLTDPKGRVVSDRRARPDDLLRMRGALGQ
ncbi:MAG: hypothetical protein WBN04_13825 [Paracoccaceae bacterium]